MPRDASSHPPMTDKRPKPRRRLKHRGLLVFMVLALAAVLVGILVPSIRSRFKAVLAHPAAQGMNSSVTVWANKQTGNYYCKGSREYGKGQGTYMKQGKALTTGYQPQLGLYCTSGLSQSQKRN